MFCAAKGRKNGESRKNTALPRVCWPLANVGTALWLNYIFNLSAGGALQAIKWQIKFSSGFYFICHSGACNFCIFFTQPPAANSLLLDGKCVFDMRFIVRRSWRIIVADFRLWPRKYAEYFMSVINFSSASKLSRALTRASVLPAFYF